VGAGKADGAVTNAVAPFCRSTIAPVRLSVQVIESPGKKASLSKAEKGRETK